MINKYSILNCVKYFSLDGLQNYLVYIKSRLIYCISKDSSNSKIESWGFAGMSQESIKNTHTSDINFAPELTANDQFKKVRFKGICLKSEHMFFHNNVVTLYISYESDAWLRDLNTYFALDNCLFGAVKLTKNVNKYMYIYIYIAANIAAAAQYSILVYNFHGRMEAREKMSLLLELIIVIQCILMVERKISQFLGKTQIMLQ